MHASKGPVYDQDGAHSIDPSHMVHGRDAIHFLLVAAERVGVGKGRVQLDGALEELPPNRGGGKRAVSPHKILSWYTRPSNPTHSNDHHPSHHFPNLDQERTTGLRAYGP